MNKKFQELTAFIAKLGMTQEELEEWFYSQRTETDENLFSTPLPIAYFKDNEITVKPGFDFERSNEIWGIQLPNGVILSVQCYHMNWEKTRELAASLIYKGRAGRLPVDAIFKKDEHFKVMRQFIKTLEVLTNLQVTVQTGYGCCWLGNEPNYFKLCSALDLKLNSVKYFDCNVKSLSLTERIAVIF